MAELDEVLAWLEKLIKAKGRFHTEQNYKELEAAYLRYRATQPASAPADIECLRCEGRGKHAAFDGITLTDVQCKECGGGGRTHFGAPQGQAEPCTLCDGTGALNAAGAKCPHCDGCKVELPSGVSAHDVLQGQAEPVALLPCDCTPRKRWNCDYCAGYGKGSDAAPTQPTQAEREPGGFVLVPRVPTTAMVCAIEAEIDSQLVASGLRPMDMQRQDGDHVYAAMIAAAPAQSIQAEREA